MDLANKRAFVTGGSGDIGRAIAAALAEAGCDVAISYLGFKEGANTTLNLVREAGRQTLAVQMDQRNTESIETAVQGVVEGLGGVDILVNNAGWNIGIAFPDLDSLDPDIWDRVLSTNLRGPYLLSRALAPHLKTSGAGRIVNIASVAGITPGGSSIAYACSKAALIHLTRCLAVALAPSVAVTCIAPGLVEGTRMASRLPELMANRARETAVLGRVGDAYDVSRQVVTFCQAESVTGQVVAIDGGTPVGMA